MESNSLLLDCVAAFIAVFIVLSLLAIVMKLIMKIFPQKFADDDTALMAPISFAAANNFPGTKLTKIEEQK